MVKNCKLLELIVCKIKVNQTIKNGPIVGSGQRKCVLMKADETLVIT